MRKNIELILLTNRYPFYPGEEFLKLELDYLCEKFHKVHIIPINAIDRREQRDTPSNVIVHTMPNSKGRKPIFHQSRKLQVFLDKQGRKWFVSDLKPAVKQGYKAVLKLLSWVSIGIDVRDYVKKKIIKSEHSTIFVGYSYWLSLAPGIAMIKEENDQFYTYSRGHGGDIYEFRHSPPYLPLKLKVIKNLNKLHLISNNGLEYLISQSQEIEKKLQVSRLGTRNGLEVIFPKPSNVLRIVSCSYIVPVKRLNLLIEALKMCKVPIQWTHIGDGPDRGRIEELSKELPGNIDYTFVGNLSNDQVFSFYMETPVDLFVNVSSSEGIPVSIMEAYSFGIPAVATDVGGTSEIVNEENGRLVSKDISHEKLATVFEDFAKYSEDEIMQKRKSAYKIWQQLYNADQNYKKFSKEIGNVGEN